jgi:hypothetical protein
MIDRLRVLPLVLLGCHPNRGSAEPETLPCAGSSTQCIELSQKSQAEHDEPAQVVRERAGFCGAMISTYPLAVAASGWRLTQIAAHLVGVCYERGQLPKSELMACREAVRAADEANVAALEDYKQLVSQRLHDMSHEQALQFQRAVRSAQNEQFPAKNECSAPRGAETPAPDGPRNAPPRASPIDI